ncbi:BPSS1780 family membrane protein [Noviherbaspirillum aerium]|uniref:BPSS1780 family membrane protein n=1 Tax=Noviherbaspirillum aerium TaxID=2588497 RepID=UPI00124E9F3A|nr:BPSS1780 family membrane protein [Noviherbaspirillum aerium]
MEKLPANAGWLWVKQGFALFRKQPAEMSTLFLAYMFLMVVVGILPLLGQILPMVLIPVFSMAFMQACVQVEDGKKVYPNLLLAGFRSPAFLSLVKLGFLYLIAAVAAIAASALIDGGVFWQVMSSNKAMDAETIRNSNMSLGMMLSALVYTPAAMAFWYAAPLIAWQKMGIGKAIFYSFFAVKRAGKAFLVYGLAWLLIGVLVPVIVSSIVALLISKPFVVMLVLLPLSLMLTVVMYCSFYPTYTTVFGRPESLPAPRG